MIRFSHDAQAGPVLRLPVESVTSRILLLALTLAGAAWAAKVIVSPAIATYLAPRAETASDLERATTWDSENPELHLRLANAYQALIEKADLARTRLHLVTALRQRPTHSLTWLQLALLADRRADRERSRHALETALRMDRYNVSLRWEAALLALRWGEREEALEHLRYVLAVDPARRDAAFQLGRAVLEPGEPVARLLPEEPEFLTGLVEAAVRHGDLPLAQAAWERRAPLAPSLPTGLQRQYLELLLAKGESWAARRVWLGLVRNGHPGDPRNMVWNGSFESATLLGWGLDWQIRRVWGVEVALDRFVAADGRQSLRLTFNSFPTLDFAGVLQNVAVETDGEYRLRARAKALGFVTRSGLTLQVTTPDGKEVLAETNPIAGTTAEWVPLEARVRIPPPLSLVQVRLRREKAPGPEGNLGGKVWVDDVSLVPRGGSGG